MNELRYLLLMTEAPKVHFDAFNETHHLQHAAELLASIGDFKRLKPEWKRKIASSVESAEAFAKRIGSKALSDAAEHFDFSAIIEKIELLETISHADLVNEDHRFEARLAFDEFFDERDQTHLALWEFKGRGIPVSKEKWDQLASLDQRSKSNEIVRWAMLLPRPYLVLYDPDALWGLWWWDPKFAGQPEASMLLDTLSLLHWDEALITDQIRQLHKTLPDVIPHLINSLVQRFILQQDTKTSRKRLKFLRRQINKLDLTNEMLSDLDLRYTLISMREISAAAKGFDDLIRQKGPSITLGVDEQVSRRQQKLSPEQETAKLRAEFEERLHRLQKEKQQALEIQNEAERVVRLDALDHAIQRLVEWRRILSAKNS